MSTNYDHERPFEIVRKYCKQGEHDALVSESAERCSENPQVLGSRVIEGIKVALYINAPGFLHNNDCRHFVITWITLYDIRHSSVNNSNE